MRRPLKLFKINDLARKYLKMKWLFHTLMFKTARLGVFPICGDVIVNQLFSDI